MNNYKLVLHLLEKLKKAAVLIEENNKKRKDNETKSNR